MSLNTRITFIESTSPPQTVVSVTNQPPIRGQQVVVEVTVRWDPSLLECVVIGPPATAFSEQNGTCVWQGQVGGNLAFFLDLHREHAGETEVVAEAVRPDGQTAIDIETFPF